MPFSFEEFTDLCNLGMGVSPYNLVRLPKLISAEELGHPRIIGGYHEPASHCMMLLLVSPAYPPVVLGGIAPIVQSLRAFQVVNIRLAPPSTQDQSAT